MSYSFKSLVNVAGLAVLMLGIVLAFSACGGGGGLVGKWTNADLSETIELTDDGIMFINSAIDGNLEFTYKAEGGNLVLGMEGTEGTFPIAYSLDGDVLTLTDPDKGPTPYDRVK